MVELDEDFGKPIHIVYHTEHLVNTTGRERLAEGGLQSLIGILHNEVDRFKIEPLVIGTPLLNHPWNGEANRYLMWSAPHYGEIVPEDIEQFSKMAEITVKDCNEWMTVMQKLPEVKVKEAFAGPLNEPTKNDWGRESNDLFSGNATVGGRRQTAAFLLKGPSSGSLFKEMTLDMCGKRADQVLRLAKSEADVSIVQHCHLIGEAVRESLRYYTIAPGGRVSGIARKYCLIDGQATYRILKAYGRL